MAKRSLAEPQVRLPVQQTRRPGGHAGTRGMLRFFWAAGVVSWTTSDGYLYVNGELAAPIGDLPAPETDAWRRVVDRIAWQHAYSALVRAVASNASFGGILEALPLPLDHGFAITRGRELIAVIRPTCASVPGRSPVYGNFLAPGPHWRQVARLLGGDPDVPVPAELPRPPAPRRGPSSQHRRSR